MSTSNKQQPCATAGAGEHKFDTFIGTVASSISDSLARDDVDDSTVDQPSLTGLTGYRNGGGLEVYHIPDGDEEEEDPGTGAYFDDILTMLGSCAGTISPTASSSPTRSQKRQRRRESRRRQKLRQRRRR